LKSKYLILFVTLISVVAIDQITKNYVGSSIAFHDSFPVIKGFFNITHIRNPGAAFGFLSGAPVVFRHLFFISVSIIAILILLGIIIKNKAKEAILIFSLSLILSGAVGNFIDRLRFGEVTDFLDFYIASWHWPAFNIADSAISIGGIILAFEIIRKR
jgi:signal peptidase II